MNRLLIEGDIAGKLSQYRRCLRKGQAQSSSRSRGIVNPSNEVPIPLLYLKHYIQIFLLCFPFVFH